MFYVSFQKERVKGEVVVVDAVKSEGGALTQEDILSLSLPPKQKRNLSLN